MNGSRSYPNRPGPQDSSLDALNRTIEGLEARIEGLIGSGRQAQPRPAHQPTPAAGDPLEEIRARQRQLENRSLRGGAHQPQRPGSQPDSAMRSDDRDLRGLSAMLAEMRRELKADIKDSLATEIGALREEMHGLTVDARETAIPEDLRHDLARISASVDRLGDHGGTADALRHELETLRATIDGLAREDSVRDLKSRWQTVEEQVAGIDVGGLREELVNLAYRIDDIREALAAMPGSGPVQALEARVSQLASGIEALATAPSISAAEMMQQFDTLAERLDEISRAVAIIQSTPADRFDAASLERLEARLNSMAKKIDTLEPTGSLDDFGDRIERLAARVAELADDEAIGRLDARLANMQLMLESGSGEASLPDFTDHFAELAGKIDRMDARSVSDSLAARLDDLASRIDSIPAPAPQAAAAIPDAVIGRLESLLGRAEETASRPAEPLPGLENLEARLADIVVRLDRPSAPQGMIDSVSLHGLETIEARLTDIAERLDHAYAGSGGSDDAMRSLETQIANLSELISSGAAGAGSDAIDLRLASIEEHLATSDEYVIEAARQAAEAALSAYSGQTAGQSTPQSIANIEIISALADDLKSLEQLSRKSDDRTARAFEAVQDTLLKIAGRLENLDMTPAARPSAPQPVSTMPQASLEALDRAMAASFDDDHDGSGDERLPQHADAAESIGRPARPARAPAVAAALAAEHAAAAEAASGQPDAAASAKAAGERSFLAGIASRIRSSKEGSRQEGPAEPRFTEAHVPPLEPALELDPATANMPLEPGSGAPDINRILQKVREAQAAERGRGETQGSGMDKAEFLASARRAAMAAAAEVETFSRNGKTGSRSGLLDIVKARRKPILMAVGAVLLVVMTLPLIQGFLADDPLVEQAVNDPVIVEPAVPAAPDENSAASPEAVVEPAAPAGADAGAAPAPEIRLVEPEAADTPGTSASAEQAADSPAPVVEPVSAQSTGQPVPAADAGAVLQADLDALPDGFIPAALSRAAVDGNPLAFYEIGSRFTDGRGAPVDLERAAAWYLRAANLGHAPAEYRIANFYEKGSGIDRDINEAKKWYQLAAEQGNASAMHNLAVLYATTGAAPDYESAATWFIKAAEVGVRDSQVNLAILYARGDGVPRDLEQSYKWFAVAASEGDKDAAAKRDEVYNALRPEQAENAKALVAGWKPEPLNDAANSVEIPAEWGGVETRTASVDMTKAIRNIQAILNKLGFDAGTADGVMGAKTVSAIKAFQQSAGMEPTGEITDVLVRELLARNG
ncbi:peptidoglycan-binding protein [Hoeflea marina]|nr:peptidoglycan-binding protein [Hoeflea marina]